MSENLLCIFFFAGMTAIVASPISKTTIPIHSDKVKRLSCSFTILSWPT